MGDGSMVAWNQLVHRVAPEQGATIRRGNVVAGKTADGSTVGYDFEGSTNSWTSTATLSSSADRAQTGTKSLKAVYGGGSGTVRIAGPATLSLAAGKRAHLYVYLDAATNVTSIGDLGAEDQRHRDQEHRLGDQPPQGLVEPVLDHRALRARPATRSAST